MYHTISTTQSQDLSESNPQVSTLSWDDLPLHPDHKLDLQKSGLLPETVQASGIYTARPGDIDRLVGWHDDRIKSSLVIPYPTVPEFRRVKVFPPINDDDGHTMKYAQPKGTAPHLYIPPKSQASLHHIATPLFIVEGEKKALKGAQDGLGCVVGLGGIWSFKSGGNIIPELDGIPVEGRRVEIIPDSDWKTNEHVDAAVKELGRYLSSKGASVCVVDLPEWNASKIGLDDYLLANTIAQYSRLPRKNFRKKKTINASLNGETPLSDQFNAEMFVKRNGENVRYCYAWGKWLVWNGKRWDIDDSGEVMRLAKQTIKDMAGSIPKADDKRVAEMLQHIKGSLLERRLKAMLVLAQSEPGIPVEPKQFDTDPYLLNCRNCTIDLRTGEMRAHKREDLITKMIRGDIDYDPLATCPHWESALLRFMGEKQGMVDFLQRASGYSMTGVVREHVLLFMYGAGQNGKSTFSETMQALMGDYFQKAPISLLMTKDGGGREAASPDVARLLGVRMVIANEIQEGHYLSESQVKDLTGGDTLVARKLHHDYFEFQPTHKVWMYGNHKPTIKGTDDGIWRRPKLVEFGLKIPESEKIEDFREKYLIPELSGILAWAVRGAIAWYQGGLQVPDEVNMATAEYRNEMDVVQRFIDEKCEINSNARIEVGLLYKAYKQWCLLNSEEALSGKAFGERIESKGFVAKKSMSTRYRIGLGLSSSDDDESHPF